MMAHGFDLNVPKAEAEGLEVQDKLEVMHSEE